MATDEDDALARLGRLEAEVKAEADGARRRKTDAEAKVRAQRARSQTDADELRSRQAAIVKARPRGRTGADLDDALALARRAADAKHELSRPREAGEKSWLISGGASFLFGPLGWLYAGAWREAVPASVIYVLLTAIVTSIIPMFLLMPVLMVVLPLSGIAGVVYAIGHNRNQRRVRLFGDDDAEKKDKRIGQLGAGEDEDL